MIFLNNEQNTILTRIKNDFSIFQNKSSLSHKISSFLYNKNNKKGYYISGVSGCGKTTLVNYLSKDICKKYKIINMHFNDYFIDISRILQKYNYSKIADIISSKIDILCFDEFFIE